MQAKVQPERSAGRCSIPPRFDRERGLGCRPAGHWRPGACNASKHGLIGLTRSLPLKGAVAECFVTPQDFASVIVFPADDGEEDFINGEQGHPQRLFRSAYLETQRRRCAYGIA